MTPLALEPLTVVQAEDLYGRAVGQELSADGKSADQEWIKMINLRNKMKQAVERYKFIFGGGKKRAEKILTAQGPVLRSAFHSGYDTSPVPGYKKAIVFLHEKSSQFLALRLESLGWEVVWYGDDDNISDLILKFATTDQSTSLQGFDHIGLISHKGREKISAKDLELQTYMIPSNNPVFLEDVLTFSLDELFPKRRLIE